MPTQLSVVRQLNGTRGPGTGTCCLCWNDIPARHPRNNQKSQNDFSASGWICPPSLGFENSTRTRVKRNRGAKRGQIHSHRSLHVIMEKFPLFIIITSLFTTSNLSQSIGKDSGKIRNRVFRPSNLSQTFPAVFRMFPASVALLNFRRKIHGSRSGSRFHLLGDDVSRLNQSLQDVGPLSRCQLARPSGDVCEAPRLARTLCE